MIGFENSIPILRVNDLEASLRFYTGMLGFKMDWRTPTFASVSRDRATIMLCQQQQGQPGTWVWIGVEDIRPLYDDFFARGVKIHMKPTNFSFAYEMRVEDPDGHVLRMGSDRREDLPVVSI